MHSLKRSFHVHVLQMGQNLGEHLQMYNTVTLQSGKQTNLCYVEVFC